MGFVSILDDEKQYHNSAQSIVVAETNLGEEFCVQTLKQGETIICDDTHQHPIFRRYQAVRRLHSFVFMRGALLKHVMGLLWVPCVS